MRPQTRPEPLYRKVNTRARGVRHRSGGDYRHSRNTKAEAANEAITGSMHGKVRRGLDYTPLFRFLLSKVGQDWDAVQSEAVARLDRAEPIFWMVARTEAEMQPYFRAGESAYFSKLRIGPDNRLERVDPAFTNERMWPSCGCCTHTFNGTPLVNRYDPSRSLLRDPE